MQNLRPFRAKKMLCEHTLKVYVHKEIFESRMDADSTTIPRPIMAVFSVLLILTEIPWVSVNAAESFHMDFKTSNQFSKNMSILVTETASKTDMAAIAWTSHITIRLICALRQRQIALLTLALPC